MSDFKVDILAKLLIGLFWVQVRISNIRAINYPREGQFILALWHAHQCVLYNIKTPSKINVLISRSKDGEIITRAVESLGIKVVRGSKGRHGAEATLTLLERLEQGESAAITVDGPKGPNRVVKPGIINIAKLSQVPIIPVVWHSDSLAYLSLNSWDNFNFPIWGVKTLALYGEPMYVKADATEEELEEARLKLENRMKNLELDLKDNYADYKKIAVKTERKV